MRVLSDGIPSVTGVNPVEFKDWTVQWGHGGGIRITKEKGKHLKETDPGRDRRKDGSRPCARVPFFRRHVTVE